MLQKKTRAVGASLRLAGAIALLLGALVPRTAAAGPADPRVAEAKLLSAQVDKLYEAGRYQEALPLAERALALREAALGPKDIAVAEALSDLGLLAKLLGDYDRAEAAYRRALELFLAARGPDDREVGQLHHNLAQLYQRTAAWERAESEGLEALRIKERALGPNHPDVAATLNSLAELAVVQGAYDRAEPLLLRALKIRETALGPRAPAVADTLSSLGMLYRSLGAPDRAEPLCTRALAVREAALPPEHPDIAQALSNLALTYKMMGATDRAEPLYLRALAQDEKALGPDHPEVATASNNLALLYEAMGQPARARPLLVRALAIRRARLGERHPLVASSLNNLGMLEAERGAFAEAEPLLARAAETLEATSGADAPELAAVLANRARALVGMGRGAEATPVFARAFAVAERMLRSVRMISTESRLSAYLFAVRQDEDTLYTFAAQRPADPAARRLALETALLRKGRSIDEAAETSRAVRQSLAPGDRRKLDELRALRSRMAGLALAGPGRQTRDRYLESLHGLEEHAERLEGELAARSAPLRAQRQLPPPGEVVERVAAALPPESALVEVVAYHPYPFGATGRRRHLGPLRYLALVLLPEGRVEAADLGAAAPLDAAVRELLEGVAHPGAPYLGAARKLDRMLLGPVRPLFGTRHELLVSLDGQLNLVPLGVLHDGTGFAADRTAFQYLTSGRDLLRQAGGLPRSHSAIVMADPRLPTPEAARRFDPAAGAARGMRLSELVPLPGTREEAEALQRLLPSARVLIGEQASEPALLGLEAPGILHVATHGIFLEDVVTPAAASGTRALHLVGAGPPPHLADALLRSALVLAAPADRSTAPLSDGLATALEVAGMNLWGTQLVVLSACDSGRGEARVGQGVYGLRRAVMVAGAETLVTSLWKVDDAATRDLMIRYYTALLQGRDRVRALDEAARAIRQTHPHPFYWAPFIALGRGGPLEGAPGAAIPPIAAAQH